MKEFLGKSSRAALLLALLAGCGTVDVPVQKLSTSAFYERDMVVTVNGKTFIGAGVAEPAQVYKFHVEARGNLDLFIMNTCHKEAKKESAWNVKKKVKTGLFGWGRKKIDVKNEVTFDYHPNKGIEDDGRCPMELWGIEKGKGRNSWAFIEFEGPRYLLEAVSRCNGVDETVNGVAVCQSRQGLKQVIEFPEEVHPAGKAAECGFSGDASRYEYALVKGKCTAVFLGKTSRRRFRLVTLGYEKILIRE